MATTSDDTKKPDTEDEQAEEAADEAEASKDDAVDKSTVDKSTDDDSTGEADDKAADEEQPAAESADDEDKPRTKKSRKSAKRTPGVKRPPSQTAVRAPMPPAAPGGSLGKSMLLFLIVIALLGGAFFYFGGESGGPNVPKWKVGQKVDVEITLIAEDSKNLACLSPEELNGRHCAFESDKTAWSKGDGDDKMLLRPYTTTDQTQFLAAGVWSEPVLTARLPNARFAIRCTLLVEGKIKRPKVRWSPEGAWLDQTRDWDAGIVSNCRMVSP